MSLNDDKPWPGEYEPPKLYNVETELQMALGVTYCSTGYDASGGSGVCGSGYDATGTPDDPNACAVGNTAKVGPGHGNSPCGHGYNAEA